MNYEKDGFLDREILKDPESVREAIADGADVGARDGWGMTPMFGCENPQSLRLLIAAGAHVNAQDNEGLTALHICPRTQIAKLLIEAGANVNARDIHEKTPLHTIENPEITIALLESGADWTLVNKYGETAAQSHRYWKRFGVAEAIEQWVAARERAGTVNACLDEAEAQHGPGL